jgi:hypothetical protein
VAPEPELDVVAGWLEAHPEGEARLQHLMKDRPDPAALALRRPDTVNLELDAIAGLTAHRGRIAIHASRLAVRSLTAKPTLTMP